MAQRRYSSSFLTSILVGAHGKTHTCHLTSCLPKLLASQQAKEEAEYTPEKNHEVAFLNLVQQSLQV